VRPILLYYSYVRLARVLFLSTYKSKEAKSKHGLKLGNECVTVESNGAFQFKKILILKFEIVAKVCHHIENFEAFGYSFSETRPDRNAITNVSIMVLQEERSSMESQLSV
jgi:hypothetical protein